MTKQIPETFINWAYRGRAKLIQRQASGEKVPPHEIFLGFTRHNPAVVSYGPAGLNASIKGVEYLPKEEYLQEYLDAYLEHINKGWREGYGNEGLQLLVKMLYGPGCEERIDFSLFGSLELARDHSYTNLQANDTVTLLFYEPPVVSFELRGKARIYEEGTLYHKLINAQHDIYHQPHLERWPNRPAYVFTIEEMFDNSASKQGFGRKIL